MGRVIPLRQLPPGTSVFVDTNIFIYHFIYEATESSSSSAFLKRLETGAHRGYTSPIVLSELIHRLLVFTAIQRHRLEPKNAVRFLKEHPDHVKTLSTDLEAVSEIRNMGISVLSVEPEDMFLSLAHQQRHGLMNNDSANLQIMLRNGIFSIATNDSDFERVDAITVYKP